MFGKVNAPSRRASSEMIKFAKEYTYLAQQVAAVGADVHDAAWLMNLFVQEVAPRAGEVRRF